jgi:hypothetical protein
MDVSLGSGIDVHLFIGTSVLKEGSCLVMDPNLL